MDFNGDFSELVCENGRIVLRGRSTSPSSISCSSNYDKTNANFSGLQETNPRKRSRLSWVKNYESFVADDYHPEFTRFMEISTNHNGDNNYIVEPQTVPVCHDENLTRQVYESDVEAPQLTKARSDQLHIQGYLQQCQVGLSTVAGFPESDLQMLNSSEQFGLRNMSLFPAAEHVLPKTNSEQNGDPNSSKVGNDALAQSLLAGCQDPRPSKVKQIRGVSSFPEEQVPDEHSEAPPYVNDIKTERVFDRTTSLQSKTVRRKLPDAAASSRSLGSSNGPISKDVDEAARAGFKKRRTPEVHNQSERKRRAKINKKLRALQALLPNSDKVDKASTLDNAIEYLKSLQLQLQIMSAGSSTSMPPVMMPTMLPQMQLMGLGMGMRMPIGPLPFVNSAMLGQAAVLPLPVMSQPAFIPFVGAAGNSSTSSVPPFSGAVASAPPDVMGSAASLFSSIQKSFQATRQSPTH